MPNDVTGWPAFFNGLPEIAPHQVLDENPVLFEIRFVQAQLRPYQVVLFLVKKSPSIMVRGSPEIRAMTKIMTETANRVTIVISRRRYQESLHYRRVPSITLLMTGTRVAVDGRETSNSRRRQRGCQTEARL